MLTGEKEILIAQSPLFLAGIAHVCSAPIRRASQAAVSKPGCLLLDIERMNGTTDFMVNIRESGVCTIVVEARRAKGTVHVPLKEEAYSLNEA